MHPECMQKEAAIVNLSKLLLSSSWLPGKILEEETNFRISVTINLTRINIPSMWP